MSEAHLPDDHLSMILGEVKEVRVSHKGPRRTRLDVAADALPALLELLKESLVEVVQTDPFGPIHLKSTALSADLPDSVEEPA